MSELPIPNISSLRISTLVDSYRRGESSPTEVVSAALRRIDELNDQLSAFCFIDAEGAEAAASESARRWERGQERGPLDGVPIALKDNITAIGMPSFWGAAATTDELRAFDSFVVARLREAGAILLGKTSMAELGLYASGVSSRYRDARNPWNPTRTAGGSSGGAAAAVAAGMCAAAIASDGAGSIRMPASFCGVVGVKPTGGRVPVFPSRGRNPATGPITGTVHDAVLLMQAIAQPDDRDPYSTPFPPDDYLATTAAGVRGMRIGYVPDIGYGEPACSEITEAVLAVTHTLEKQGAVVETCKPIFDNDISAAAVDAEVAQLAMLARGLLDGKTETLLPTTQQILAYASDVTLPNYLNATQNDVAAIARFSAAVRLYDVILTPTLPRTAFEAGTAFPADAERNEFGYAFGFAAFVHIVNKAEVPACTVPCGHDSAGLPIGVQIIGKRHRDSDVLRVAAACEGSA